MNAKSHKTVVAVVVTALVALGSIFACQQENLWDLATLESAQGGLFVAAGSQGVILYSENGAEWSRSFFSDVNCYFVGIASDYKGTWIAVGQYSGNNGVIYASNDGGATWQLRYTLPLPSAQFTSIATDQAGHWVAVSNNTGRCAYSTDNGHTWNESNTLGGTMYGISYHQGRFATAGSGGIGFYYSDSYGASWSPTSGVPAFTFYSITYSNSKFLAVGPNNEFLTSPSGDVWTINTVLPASFSSTRNFISSSPKGRIIAIGLSPSDVYYTDNGGGSWSVASSTGSNLYGIAYGKGKWVAVGEIAAITAAIHYSTDDGASWSGNTAPSGSGNFLRCVAFGYR